MQQLKEIVYNEFTRGNIGLIQYIGSGLYNIPNTGYANSKFIKRFYEELDKAIKEYSNQEDTK